MTIFQTAWEAHQSGRDSNVNFRVWISIIIAEPVGALIEYGTGDRPAARAADIVRLNDDLGAVAEFNAIVVHALDQRCQERRLFEIGADITVRDARLIRSVASVMTVPRSPGLSPVKSLVVAM